VKVSSYWIRVIGMLILMSIGTACTLNQSESATLTPAPSPTFLSPTPTLVTLSATPTKQSTATSTPTDEPTNTALPPTSTIIPRDTVVPTLEPNVSLRPPSNRTYAYDKPGPDGSLIRLIQSNQYIRVIGRTSDSTWLQVEFSDNAKGWVTASSVITTVNTDDLAITGTIIPQDYIATVRQDGEGLRLRLAPYVEENILLYLSAGESLIVDGRLSDDVWLQVRRTNGVSGWVMRGFVDIPFDINAVPVVDAPPNITVEPVVNQPTIPPAIQPTNVPVVQPTTLPQVEQPTTVPNVTQPEIIINEGQVSEEGNGLRLRELPTLDSRVFFNLEEFTTVTVNGRTADSTWVLIDTPSQGEGWVATQYLDLFFDLSAIPVVDNPFPVNNPFASVEVVAVVEEPPNENGNPPVIASSGPGKYVFQSGIRGTGSIYARGQSLGNNPFLFTKVGDSLTATAGFLYQINWGNYNLGDYGYLQSVIDHFGSSFGHTAKSMYPGWKSYSVLTPDLAGDCLPGEIPLQCEYRQTRPAFALILLGTNDVHETNAGVYEANMRDVIEISIDNGVVPILSTVPLRLDSPAQIDSYNGVLRRLAGEYSIPLWDLYNETINLPASGISSDTVHLSVPNDDLGNSANFSGGNLQYGMNARNLGALRILESMLQGYVW
jgi:uncharacterized protein YraI